MRVKRNNRKLFAAILCTALVFALSAGSLAAEVAATATDTPTVTLSDRGNVARFTFNRDDTNLFDNFQGVMPGDSLSQTIAVETPALLDGRNSSDYNIYLTARPGHTAEDGESAYAHAAGEHNQGFYALLGIEVKDDETGEVLDLVNVGQDTRGVHLGLFSQNGTTRTLTITLTLPASMDNTYRDAVAYIDWVFYAEGIDEEPTPTTVPPTTTEGTTTPVPPVTTTSVPTTVPEEEITTQTPLTPTEPGTQPPTQPSTQPPEEEIDLEDALGDLEGEKLDDMPKTGFQSRMFIWATLAVVSGGLLVFLLLGLKPQKSKS